MCPHLHHAHVDPAPVELESAFTVDASRVTFGAGALHEVGHRVAGHLPDGGRVALFTDTRLRATEWYDDTLTGLRRQNLEVVVFDGVLVEPTDVSIAEGVAFARETGADAFVSLGGG